MVKKSAGDRTRRGGWLGSFDGRFGNRIFDENAIGGKRRKPQRHHFRGDLDTGATIIGDAVALGPICDD
jgi:hypothetical protein